MKKKIVIFTETLTTFGGVERVVSFLANELKSEYEIIILTMYGLESTYINVDCRIKSLNINTAADSPVNKIKRYLLTIVKLKNFLQHEKNIDYFIANSPALSSITMLVKQMFNQNLRVIICEHTKFSFPGRIWRFIRNKLFCKAYKIIALTNDAHREYLKINCHSIHIPNALIIKVSQPSLIKNKKLLAVGRLAHVKGFDSLLHAWEKVIADHPDWILEIVGSGEEEESLKKLAIDLNIDNSVHFFGHTNNVQERYIDASGFILSSRYEGFCLVMIEAMAHGLPCISFDCESGPNEVIQDGINGYLVADQDINALASSIKKYIELPEQKKQEMSFSAQNTSKQYMPEIIIDRWKKEVLKE